LKTLITELYLIRHGIAGEPDSYANDAERQLTAKGKKKTKAVAKRLYEIGVRFDLILTSPLVRSRQTADILYSVGLSSKIEESPYLAPNGDFYAWLGWLQKWRDTFVESGSDRTEPKLSKQGNKSQRSLIQLALVGHQPDLGNWAEILLWGDARQKITLKKAGVIGLTIPATTTPVAQSQQFLLTSPKQLTMTNDQ
jgi:phosphohistidine phosphatase